MRKLNLTCEETAHGDSENNIFTCDTGNVPFWQKAHELLIHMWVFYVCMHVLINLFVVCLIVEKEGLFFNWWELHGL